MEAKYQPILAHQFRALPQLRRLGEAAVREMETVARVLPFKINRYVVEELIDWNRVPEDPIFQLTFPHREMLPPEHFAALHTMMNAGANEAQIATLVSHIRLALNPHPADQTGRNVPMLDDDRVEGLQHKYRETVLFFPRSAQTCHAYCAFCFRWPQFVDPSMRMALEDASRLPRYLRQHKEVTDILITGGDPMTMSARRLEQYLAPLLGDDLDHVTNIRIGTKALSFWPHRFLSDRDSDDLMRLFERIVRTGKHLAIMMHINHPVELSGAVAQRAVSRLHACGAQLRSQSPVLRHVNDEPAVWRTLWAEQVRLGIHPYYMFVPRDTGARSRFDLPLVRALEIYQQAIRVSSGLGRTARGPIMSTSPGKVEIQGLARLGGGQVFVLSFLQARDPAWVRQPFFARFDERATWFDELRPAQNTAECFFSKGEGEN